MKKIFLLLSLVIFYVTASAQQQYATLDSLRGGINRYIKTSPIDAFQGFRMNGIMNAVVDFLGGASGTNGVDSIWNLTDTSLRYRLASGTVLTVSGFKGSSKVTSLFQSGDSLGVITDLTDTAYFTGFAGTGAYDPNELRYNWNPLTSELCDSCPVTKQNLLDAIASVSTSTITFSDQFTGTGLDPDVIRLDTAQVATRYDADTLHLRDSLLAVSIAGIGRKVDTIYRTAGIDSIYFKISGTTYAVKDSTGGAGTGDGIGSVGVLHDAMLSGTGKVGDSLKVDTAAGKIATKYNIKTYQINASTGISVNQTTDANGNVSWTVTNTGSPGSNPLNALDIRTYGGIGDATVPGSGASPSGTNNTPFLQAAIAAAADGQWVIVPPVGGSGKGYKFSTALDTITGGSTSVNKRVYLLFLADVYLDNNDFIRVKNEAGGYEQHKIVFEGNIYGRVNQSTHSSTTYLAGTGPVWSTYTGVAVKLIDVNQVYVQFNFVTGCKAPIEIIGGVGANAGSQENTVVGRRYSSNRYGILLTSYDGTSFVDKNYFGGPNGGTLRIGGDIPLMIDGYSDTASNGENWNGAFRSNEFHFMIENADSLPVCNGDITENWFDITVEGGSTTGVLSSTATWHMRTASPNYVRAPRYTWKGVYGAHRMGTGSTGTMGIDGKIIGSIWAQGSTAYYGNEADIDGTGNIVIRCKEATSNTVRSAAPAYIKFNNGFGATDNITITASTYTIPFNVKNVIMNNAAATVTLPTASTYPGREINIFNINANQLTVSGAASGQPTVILDSCAATYVSNGAGWYATGDGVGQGGGGGGGITTVGPISGTADAEGATISGSTITLTPASSSFGGVVSNGTQTFGGAKTFNGTVTTRTGSATAGTAPLKIPDGTLLTTEENGAIENEGSDLYFTDNTGTRQKILTDQNNATVINKTIGYTAGGTGLQTIGTAGQRLRVNQAGTGYEFSEATVQDLTTNYAVAAGDYWIMYNGSVGTFTVTLPSPSGNTGRELVILKGGTNTVVNMSGTIVGSGSIASSGAGSITYWCDGSFWRVKHKWHD